jgi:heat shock protein HslJ
MSTPALVRLAAGLAALSLLGACSPGAAAIGDRQFLSVNVTDGGVARPLVPGTRIRLNFQGANLSASAGCNTIGGTYRIEGGRLVFEGAGMTEMGCDPERHAQDDWLAQVLGSKPVLRLAGNDLTLESGAIVVTLLDREVAEPDANLVGPTWTLISIIQGDAASSVPEANAATLVFRADGSLEVFAGCNRGGGTYATVGGGIQVSGIALTKMACDQPGATIESAVVAVLNAGTIAASIDADMLTLQAGQNGLQLQAR